MITHDSYPSDVSDSEWEFVVPYLCLLLGPCLLIREFHERPLLRLKDRWFPL